MPCSILNEPAYTIRTTEILSISIARGAITPILTFALIMFSAITFVASAILLCSLSSLSKARITRIPRSLSRMIPFCLSIYPSEIRQSGSILLPIKTTTTKTIGTRTKTIDESSTSFLKERKTPPMNRTGTETMLLESIEAIQLSVSVSWVERVTRAAVPSSFISLKVMVLTLAKTTRRRSQQKPEVTSALYFLPISTVTSPKTATTSIYRQYFLI